VEIATAAYRQARKGKRDCLGFFFALVLPWPPATLSYSLTSNAGLEASLEALTSALSCSLHLSLYPSTYIGIAYLAYLAHPHTRTNASTRSLRMSRDQAIYIHTIYHRLHIQVEMYTFCCMQ
jgi:hypothetical protein